MKDAFIILFSFISCLSVVLCVFLIVVCVALNDKIKTQKKTVKRLVEMCDRCSEIMKNLSESVIGENGAISALAETREEIKALFDFEKEDIKKAVDKKIRDSDNFYANTFLSLAKRIDTIEKNQMLCQ